jgi:hypothetical protein
MNQLNILRESFSTVYGGETKKGFIGKYTEALLRKIKLKNSKANKKKFKLNVRTHVSITNLASASECKNLTVNKELQGLIADMQQQAQILADKKSLINFAILSFVVTLDLCRNDNIIASSVFVGFFQQG